MGATREIQVTFDCADPGALATFWAEALGYQLESPPPGFATWDEALDAWGVPADQRNSRSAVVDPSGDRAPALLPAGARGQDREEPGAPRRPGRPGLRASRMAALAAESDRLVALGASVLRRVDPDGAMEAGFITLQDPEGNEFCLD